MKSAVPEELEPVDERARSYPASWKNAAIRELYDESRGGVPCALCGRLFRGHAELRLLQADHIVPWSRNGPTTWQNLQLLCKPCNVDKLNSV